MTAKKTYFVGKNFPRVAKRNDLAINTEDGTVNYRGPNGWVSVGGSGGSGGSLTVPTSIKDSNGSDFITFSRTGTGTARIGTPQDDLSLRSARDITLYAGDDGPGNVYIGWGDAQYTPDSLNRVATIGDIVSPPFITDLTLSESYVSGYTGSDGSKWGIGSTGHTVKVGDVFRISGMIVVEGVDINGEYVVDYADNDKFSSAEFDAVFGETPQYLASSWAQPNVPDLQVQIDIRSASLSTGDITFDGVKIIGAGTGSGDGYNNGTIELVPDADLYDNGQRLIIDPTVPNHIHIRAGEHVYGGSSNPELYLGDDKTNLGIMTWSGDVAINTQNHPRVFVQNINTESSNNIIIDNAVSADWSVFNTLILEDGSELPVTSYDGNSLIVDGFTFTPNSYYYFYDNLVLNRWSFGNNGVLSGPVNQYVTVNGLNITNNRNLYLGGEDMGGYFSAPVRLASGNQMGTNIPFFELVSRGTATFSSIDSDIILQTYNGGQYINSVSSENQIATIGNLAYIRASVPTSSIGVEGDVEGMVADDGNFHYYCTGDYDGTNHVWKRVGWTAGTWGV
jgi:hypothetical protein